MRRPAPRNAAPRPPTPRAAPPAPRRFKDENKAVALGTSKINYMDPRITAAWCKATETPIEKCFPQTLIKKFPWALGVPSTWRF